MSNNNRKAKIYQEDTVEDEAYDLVGVVTRTWHDQDLNDGPDPLKEGEFVVNWLDDFGPYGSPRLDGHDLTVLHEDSDQYRLVDRSFVLGDVVKRDSSSPMSGIVQNGETHLKIRNLASREVKSCSGLEVSVEAENYQVGDYVVIGEWVGIIKEVLRKTLVRFRDGQIALCSEEELNPVEYSDHSLFYPELIPCTTIVEVSSHGVRTAKYFIGHHQMVMNRDGVVLHSVTSRIYIDWQFQNMLVPKFAQVASPPSMIDLGNATASKSSFDVRTCKLLDGVFSYQIGDIVTLKDATAPVFEPPYEEFQNSTLETLKEQCYHWIVLSTTQQISVRWQDGSQSDHLAVDLVPYLNVDDLDTWPADHVQSKSGDKSGIVQTCDAKERLALVKWAGFDTPEEVSLYDLTVDKFIDLDLGDLVLILPEDGKVDATAEPTAWGPSAIVSNISSTIGRYLTGSIMYQTRKTDLDSAMDWFGQLISIENTGMCKVSLAFERPPRTIMVPITRLIHVAGGHDDDDDSTSYDGSEMDIDSTDPESDEYIGDLIEDNDNHSSARNVQWTITSTDGTMEDALHSDWLDEDIETTDEESDDVEMIDVVAEDVTEPEVTDIVLDVSSMPSEESHSDQVTASTAGDMNQPDISSHDQATASFAICSTSKADAGLTVLQTSTPGVLPFSKLHLAQDNFLGVSVLDIEPEGHTFVNEEPNRRPVAMRRIAQEIRTLRDALPPGILVRSYESRMDLLRVLILGPLGTPYEYAPLLFDFYLPPEFPNVPPVAHFHSWTNGIGRCNPNLYEDGKVCLSLLGTWLGNTESETWSIKSSLLQLLVSLQALVLVKDPYYNEAGYEILSVRDTAIASANYSERAYVLSRGFVVHVLQNTIPGMAQELKWLYQSTPNYLEVIINRAELVVQNSKGDQDYNLVNDSSVNKVSRGALVLLERCLSSLRSIHKQSKTHESPCTP